MCTRLKPGRPHSIYCILPPHMLEHIAKHGDAKQREIAIDTLSKDHTMRSFRAVEATLAVRRAAPMPTAAAPSAHRTIYTADETETLPGTVIRTEGAKPVKDDAANEAYDGLGATFEFYLEVFHRNSIDDAGMPLIGTVHFGKDYDNAFWNSQQMVFGDGDGELFNRFTIALDVIGHELTHGVTEHTAGLNYMTQAGALNESISDVFGSLIKQYAHKQTADKADWLIGEGLLAKGVNGVALRSMKNPGTAYDDPRLGKDPQPADMSEYVRTTQDNGGVHINSGIPNKAFCMTALEIGGYAWEKAGRIWYETLTDSHLKPTATFKTFAKLTLTTASRLYGASSAEASAVKKGWHEVGVL
ncbi:MULTISPECIES: M4 family metallopeptidase [Caballeronia]|uniref:Neutral metalloproteinase n=1 Tax=Caballeronia zhejiangensis TaxID=871203 RepID=A0A656QTJ6_9BURK|nr:MULTISPECIES: M4 family metallopeptidase [Caballeronia]KDR33801.1 peptidase M4 [Caballeronia zhejiangensis]MCG7403563.1 M4 family metallopeptidase [Caballeronia zhejiangensis]MCI1044809.1 M4 family metallopeptidase [Caballeronia zhejiangensis]MDR5788664.1 M4 family metallopeptidase [Caballeronia sp. LP003]